MIFGKKGKRYTENNLAEMLALVGGAMHYIEHHQNLDGYEEYYLGNRNNLSFHYGMQKYANKVIIKELSLVGIRCKKSKAKRFYRYSIKGHNRIDNELYDYFKYVMDYILNESVLTKITVHDILQNCRCKEAAEKDNCLNTILDWHYKRLVKAKTYITQFDEKKKEKAGILLDRLKSYPDFKKFSTVCQKAHKKAAE